MKTKVLAFIGLLACALTSARISDAAFVWSTQRVDWQSQQGYCTSLALDRATGYPRISYVEWYPNLDLKYAAWNGATWEIQTVDSAGEIDGHTSLALHPVTGFPHITYHKGHDDGSIGLWYAFWNGTKWDLEHIEGVDVGRRAHLALDPNSGYPRILYTVGEHGQLKYASWNGSIWEKEVIDDEGNDGDLVLDPSTGYPCVAYLDRSDNSLKYLSWNGSGWDTQFVVSSGMLPSLRLDPNTGYPKISFFTRYTTGLYYASWNGSSWKIELVDTNGGVGHKYGRNSLALDPATGYARIAYYDAVNQDLGFAAWNGNIWELEAIDSTGIVGEYSSLALYPSSGNLHISYLDRDHVDLKYAVGQPIPEFPNDIMPPTGAVHAYPNMLWPPNGKMVEVILEGYVKDELSILRDGEGCGVSSAILFVDGNEIILSELGEDGSFSVMTEVKAERGVFYDIELYAADTKPEVPNWGFVDHTYVHVLPDLAEGKDEH